MRAHLPARSLLSLLLLGLACRAPTTAPPPAAELGGDEAGLATGESSDWCAAHGVPESTCTICHPELAAAFREAGDWCAEHALPESLCPLCGHGMAPPASAATAAAPEAGEWCAEHGLPESRCTICHPSLIPAFQAAGDWCAEHGLPESDCAACGHGSAPPSAAGFVIRFKDEERERAAGMRTVAARFDDRAPVLEAPARIDHDRNRLARVTAPIAGIVRAVLVDLGDAVSTGVALFEVDSLELARARRAAGPSRRSVALAASRVERERRLAERGIGSSAAVEEASQRLEQARAELGGIEALLELAGPRTGSEGAYLVPAPGAGTLIERPAVLGASAAAGEVLGVLSDVHSAWAWADVHAERAVELSEGLLAEVTVPGLESSPARGEITWIAPEVDARTRTVAVRIQLDDPEDRLRLNQFGLARITLERGPRTIAVPAEALQLVGDETVVFVKTAPLTYETRSVVPGRRRGDELEVEGPLGPGDPVVTVGAYLLKTELRRDSIGAGCCEVDSLGAE